MQAVAFLVVGVLVGVCLGRAWRMNAGARKGGSLSWSERTFRGWGGVALIPGGGWQAAVVDYDIEEDFKTWLGKGLPWHVERVPVIGWELFERLDREDIELEGSTTVARIHREELRAHCMDSGQREPCVLEPGDNRLIQFLAPGQEVSDEELMRRENERRKIRRERDADSIEAARVETG
jgi:hypothetical protein